MSQCMGCWMSEVWGQISGGWMGFRLEVSKLKERGMEGLGRGVRWWVDGWVSQWMVGQQMGRWLDGWQVFSGSLGGNFGMFVYRRFFSLFFVGWVFFDYFYRRIEVIGQEVLFGLFRCICRKYLEIKINLRRELLVSVFRQIGGRLEEGGLDQIGGGVGYMVLWFWRF